MSLLCHSVFLNWSGTCEYVVHPNTRTWLKWGFLPVNVSWEVLSRTLFIRQLFEIYIAQPNARGWAKKTFRPRSNHNRPNQKYRPVYGSKTMILALTVLLVLVLITVLDHWRPLRPNRIVKTNLLFLFIDYLN